MKKKRQKVLRPEVLATILGMNNKKMQTVIQERAAELALRQTVDTYEFNTDRVDKIIKDK